MKNSNWIIGLASIVILASCASKNSSKGESTADALSDLENRYAAKVGKSAKSELVEEFGSPAWCEPKAAGTETCRFYRSMGKRWKGDKENRTSYEAFDEIVADFDPQGKLRSYKARAQR